MCGIELVEGNGRTSAATRRCPACALRRHARFASNASTCRSASATFRPCTQAEPSRRLERSPRTGRPKPRPWYRPAPATPSRGRCRPSAETLPIRSARCRARSTAGRPGHATRAPGLRAHARGEVRHARDTQSDFGVALGREPVTQRFVGEPLALFGATGRMQEQRHLSHQRRGADHRRGGQFERTPAQLGGGLHVGRTERS